jgi:CelD/BcsL family acetyltransferase involved in cellulose biosynthesis
VTIDVVLPSALSPADIARWSALQARQPAWDSPFLSPGWALAVERSQPPGGRIRVVTLGRGAQAGGFMAVRIAGALAMPAGAPMNDYQALVADDAAEIAPRRLIDALGVQRLDFTHLLSETSPFAAHTRGCAQTYVVDVSDGYESYARERRAAGSGIIKDLDKRRRKAEREVGQVRFTPFAGDSGLLEPLLAWKRARYRASGQTDVFATAWTVALLRDLARGDAPGCRGAFFALHIGGSLAAVQFNLLGARTVHAWIIGHDEAFERYSPGLLLFQDVLRWMDATPYSALDLGAGDYRFKQQLANARREISHGFIGRPSPATLLRRAQYGVRAAAESLPLGAVSLFPAKAMRRLDVWRGLR